MLFCDNAKLKLANGKMADTFSCDKYLHRINFYQCQGPCIATGTEYKIDFIPTAAAVVCDPRNPPKQYILVIGVITTQIDNDLVQYFFQNYYYKLNTV